MTPMNIVLSNADLELASGPIVHGQSVKLGPKYGTRRAAAEMTRVKRLIKQGGLRTIKSDGAKLRQIGKVGMRVGKYAALGTGLGVTGAIGAGVISRAIRKRFAKPK